MAATGSSAPEVNAMKTHRMVVGIIATLVLAGSAIAQPPWPDASTRSRLGLVVGAPFGLIQEITSPRFVSAASAGIPDDAPVIGLAGAKEARAYSIRLLNRHEIVNDWFEGRPVAVTW